jgi:hypothetical protein
MTPIKKDSETACLLQRVGVKGVCEELPRAPAHESLNGRREEDPKRGGTKVKSLMEGEAELDAKLCH